MSCVESEEDHGYLISFGVKGVTGFLSRKSAKELGRAPHVGEPLRLAVNKIITNKGGRRILDMVCDTERWKAPSSLGMVLVSSLLPGMPVRGKVALALSGGLVVRVSEFVSGTVDMVNLREAAHQAYVASAEFLLKDSSWGD